MWNGTSVHAIDLKSPVGASRTRVHVSRDFYGTEDSQLSVFCDDVVELLDDSDRYWWLVREPVSGESGYVPADILENSLENEARLNRVRNQEITHPSFNPPNANNESNDSLSVNNNIDESPSMNKPWKASGFMRKTTHSISNDGIARGSHKKTVSFSERKPVEHVFTVEEEEEEEQSFASSINDEVHSSHVPTTPTVPQELDPIIEELLEREFGSVLDLKDGAVRVMEEDKLPQPSLEANIPVSPFRPVDFDELIPQLGDQRKSNGKIKKKDLLFVKGSTERETIDRRGMSLEKSKQHLRRLAEKLLGSSRREVSTATRHDEKEHHCQLLRIYAGNFSAVHGYKTMLIDENVTMAEVADKAVEKFALTGDRYNYMLSVVHCESHEILQVSGHYSLGMVIEMAKRATLMEGRFATVTNNSLSTLPKRIKKKQMKLAARSMCSTPLNIPSTPTSAYFQSNNNNSLDEFTPMQNFSCIASPIVQALIESDFIRDPTSDFVTHYKFVLNRWLEGPASMVPFYFKVKMSLKTSVQGKRIGVLPSTTSNTDAQSSSIDADHYEGADLTSSFSSPPSAVGDYMKMLVNSGMSVFDLIKMAQTLLDVRSVIPGMQYDLYLSVNPSDARERIYLSKDMLLADILHLRPMVDPSGLVLVLHPSTDNIRLKGSSTTQ